MTPALRKQLVQGLLGRVLAWMEEAGSARGSRNAWLNVPGFKVYVRNSLPTPLPWYFASSSMLAMSRTGCTMTPPSARAAFIELLHRANPWGATHIEAVGNARLAADLKANPDWTFIPDKAMGISPSFYRMTGHMGQALPESFIQYAGLTEDDWIDRTRDQAAPGWALSQVRDKLPPTASGLHLKIGHLLGQVAEQDQQLADRIQAEVDQRNYIGASYEAIDGAQGWQSSPVAKVLRELSAELVRAGNMRNRSTAEPFHTPLPDPGEMRGTVPARLAQHAFQPQLPAVKVTDTPEKRRVVQDLAAAARVPVRLVDAAIDLLLGGAAGAFFATSPVLVLAALASDTLDDVVGGVKGIFSQAADSLQAMFADASAGMARVTPSAFATKAAGPLSKLLKRAGLFDRAPLQQALVDDSITFMDMVERRMFGTGRELDQLAPATLARRLRKTMAASKITREVKATANALARALEDDPDAADLRAVVQSAQRLVATFGRRIPAGMRAVLTLIGDQSVIRGAPRIASAEASDAFVEKHRVWADRWIERIRRKDELMAVDFDKLLDGIENMIDELAEGEMLDARLLGRLRSWAGDAVRDAEIGRGPVHLVMQVPHYLIVAATGNAIQSRRAIGWLNKLEDWTT